ncbi:piggyBac transposable element-derived protein 5-like [Octopus sinensis]|uniref:PiggyBac transposable element-derived protein 5-like n=1 Tax=Octopus sinensis TaxID=2607531 RepID=A0A7E6FA88_9MOLL|nr:piggyBac transposable element-derived protein 5-like [Octopus sinensis]
MERSFMPSSCDSEFESFSTEDMEISSEILNEVQEHVVDENESDISEYETESDSEETEGSDVDSEDDFTPEWSKELKEVFINNFSEETGSTHSLSQEAKPLDFFYLFFPECLFEAITAETNRYAECKQAGKKDSLWFPTTMDEIRAFFAINIIIGIRQLPRISNYWSDLELLRDEYVSSIMTEIRFVKLNKYLHVRDTSSTPVRGEL